MKKSSVSIQLQLWSVVPCHFLEERSACLHLQSLHAGSASVGEMLAIKQQSEGQVLKASVKSQDFE